MTLLGGQGGYFQKSLKDSEILRGLLSNKNIRIPINNKKSGTPPTPRTMTLLGGQGGYFQKSSRDSETSDATSEGLGETFEGDSADMCAGKFPLMSMGGRADRQACADG